jgi:hypothetical protein
VLARGKTITSPRPFGLRSNAGNGTMPTDSRLKLGADATHPNVGFHLTSTQNRVPAISPNTGGKVESPWLRYSKNPVIQPNEKHKLHHKKVSKVHHTAFGASRVLQSDTAFQRVHPKEKPRTPIHVQQNVLRSQFDQSGMPKTEGPKFSHNSAGNFVPSFVSRQQVWYDPNNSFQAGHMNLSGRVGAGRWQTVKRGAAG